MRAPLATSAAAVSALAAGLLLLGPLRAARAEAGAEVLGFSADGRFAVLLEHGVGDGTGWPWARATILDTGRNAPAGKPVEVTLQAEGATEAAAVEQATKAALAEGEKLKLGPLRKGKQIAHDEKGELHEAAGPPIGTVEIKTRKAKGRESSVACDEPFSPLLLTVVLRWMDDDTPARLLADKKVPKDRACLTGCTLGKVVADGRSAVFLLECGERGFEGVSSRTVPIAARLAYGLDEDLPGSDAKPSE